MARRSSRLNPPIENIVAVDMGSKRPDAVEYSRQNIAPRKESLGKRYAIPAKQLSRHRSTVKPGKKRKRSDSEREASETGNPESVKRPRKAVVNAPAKKPSQRGILSDLLRMPVDVFLEVSWFLVFLPCKLCSLYSGRYLDTWHH